MKRIKFLSKALAVLLILSLLCLSGCKSGGETVSTAETAGVQGQDELPTVTVLIDLDQSGVMSSTVTEVLHTAPGCDTEYMIMTETLPTIWGDDQEREAALTRVRTELMAGKGPDVFLCENPVFANSDRGSSVFRFPEQAMERRMFLPLDGYIENAQRMEWDKLVPQVMAAGRNGDGQQILPLTYSFYVMAFNKDSFTLEAQLPASWDDMLDSSDPMVRFAATTGRPRGIFAGLADWEHDSMLVSEEDIVKRLRQIEELHEDVSGGGFPEYTSPGEDGGWYMPEDRENVAYYPVGSRNAWALPGGTDYYLIPRYNTEGGITVTIGAFAAINRNTAVPEQSFSLLESLFSLNGQRSQLLTELDGQPVHTGVACRGWGASEWNEQQFASLLEQINAAVFRNPVEIEFDQIHVKENETDDLEATVHKHYVKMQMMLAES